MVTFDISEGYSNRIIQNVSYLIFRQKSNSHDIKIIYQGAMLQSSFVEL